MTQLTSTEDSGEEFALRGLNATTGSKDDVVISYDDVTKVQVLPETGSFTIQIITPDLVVEMDFADAESIRHALELFETKKVLDVNSDPLGSVRIIPSSNKKEVSNTHADPLKKTESKKGSLEQTPPLPDEPVNETLPGNKDN